MNPMLDYTVRVTVAKWARNVSLEADTVPDHAARVSVARTMLQGLSPRTEAQDVALPNVLFLVRALVQDDDVINTAEITTTVDQIMTVYAKLGAFQ